MHFTALIMSRHFHRTVRRRPVSVRVARDVRDQVPTFLETLMKCKLWNFSGLLLILILTDSVVAQAPGFQRVGTVRQIMLGIVAPTSDVIFKVTSQTPKYDKEWKTVQDSALMLAESWSLLPLPGHQGSKAFKAVNAKEAKSLENIGNDTSSTLTFFAMQTISVNRTADWA
jgi:hypothetical protein